MESSSDNKDNMGTWIFVEDDVFRALQNQAEPLVDDATAVLRR